MVDVQKRLLQILDHNFILALVILFEGLEPLTGKRGLRAEVATDLRDVEILRLVLDIKI